MEQEYKKRHVNWNYGGPNWKLSRSKIDMFMQCPRCFYLDNKLGIRRPSMPPFNLNSTVDELLKKEFDSYRKENKPHPIMVENKISALPFSHPGLNEWRENFVGAQFLHEPTGMIISGAVDDIWVNSKKELFIVDYKATSKEEEITLNEKWKDAYKRQMEIYQWIFRQMNFDVSTMGYFVYANAIKNRESFDNRLDFDLSILSHEGSTEWIEPTIFKIKETLEGNEIPPASHFCEHCSYCRTVKETEK